jgi:divalent metal cation (Fe/Co/Zn/Cd) transporter
LHLELDPSISIEKTYRIINSISSQLLTYFPMADVIIQNSNLHCARSSIG